MYDDNVSSVKGVTLCGEPIVVGFMELNSKFQFSVAKKKLQTTDRHSR